MEIVLLIEREKMQTYEEKGKVRKKKGQKEGDRCSPDVVSIAVALLVSWEGGGGGWVRAWLLAGHHADDDDYDDGDDDDADELDESYHHHHLRAM